MYRRNHHEVQNLTLCEGIVSLVDSHPQGGYLLELRRMPGKPLLRYHLTEPEAAFVHKHFFAPPLFLYRRLSFLIPTPPDGPQGHVEALYYQQHNPFQVLCIETHKTARARRTFTDFSAIRRPYGNRH
ncbi:MAG: hypothetical protein HC945_02275 [Nitrosarchaeum sp.]|nr:hypothetical protein [Nitrosarchaeum sp.]